MDSHTALVVDDSPTILARMANLLERAGVEDNHVHLAGTLDEALAAFREHGPTVTFLDMTVGSESGLTVARAIWEQDRDAAIVIVTGMDPGAAEVREAVIRGAYDVIRKPVRLARIREVLDLLESEERGLRRIS